MRGRRKKPSLWLSVSFFWTFALFCADCGGGDRDGMPMAADTFRCREPGLCLFTTGKHSLQGGYREDGDELKFDVVYRPFKGFSVGDVYPWCIRIVDHQDEEMLFADNGHCPAAWQQKDGLQPFRGDQSYSAGPRRRDLMKKLKLALLRVDSPSDRELALRVLQEMVAARVASFEEPEKFHLPASLGQLGVGKAKFFESMTDEERDAVKKAALKEEEGEEAGSDGPVSEKDAGPPHADSQVRALPFDVLMHPRGSAGDGPDEDAWPLVGREQAARTAADEPSMAGDLRADSTVRPLQFFSKGASDGVPKISPEEVLAIPGFEFQQRLVLYSQNVKGGLVFGKRTKKHHTAMSIEVFARPLGSGGPWESLRFAHTANHGSSPLSPFMKPYDWCDDTPVTYGQTVWKGECHGGWGIGDRKHLCNDDTRLQIRNAYNIASNKRCEKVDHYHRPWCHKR